MKYDQEEVKQGFFDAAIDSFDNGIQRYAEYLDNYKSNTGKPLSESTKVSYIRDIDKFLKIKDPKKDNSYREFVIEETSKKSINHSKFAIKIYIDMRFKKDRARIQKLHNSLPSIQTHREKRIQKYLSLEDRENVVNALSTNKHITVGAIQLATGLRASDVFKLKKNSITYEKKDGRYLLKIIGKVKGNKTHIVWVSRQDYIDVITEYCCIPHPNEDKDNLMTAIGKRDPTPLLGKSSDYDEYYFLDEPERLKCPTLFQVIRSNYFKYWADIRNIITKLKLIDTRKFNPEDIISTFSTHGFRHGVGIDAYELKVPDVNGYMVKSNDVRNIQKVLGHARSETSMRYTKASGMQEIDIFDKINKVND